MPRPAKLLGFALLVPAVQLVGGLQPLQAARSGGAARDRVLPKHPVPDGLRGVGDRFLNGSGAGEAVNRQEPVPWAVTQIPGFFGAGDPLRLGTLQEPWDIDPLNREPLPWVQPPQMLAQADNRQSEGDRLLQQDAQQFNHSQPQSEAESQILAQSNLRRVEADRLLNLSIQQVRADTC